MSNSQIANILVIVLVVMFVILIGLLCVWIYLKFKTKQEEESTNNNDKQENSKTKIQGMYNAQSIFDFMEFDKIEDNMIVQKKGKRYIMVVKCQGINYDLMSGVEKTSVEQGFIQYLNTLRYPIQIYVQTRTVDLTSSISTYKQKVRELGNNLTQKEYEYNKKSRSNNYDKISLEKEKFEVTKAKNLYEYGMDIVENTERMSLNRNILRKQYYIVLSHYPEEAGNSDYQEDEIKDIAFSELYTRAQSTISLLSVCGINAKTLDSFELADLLYAAYNRDEAETYDLTKAINSGYDSMYVTAPDVLDKRMKELDKQIEAEAIERANNAIYKVKNEQEKERRLKEMEENYVETIRKLAASIIGKNANVLGEETAERAKKEVLQENEPSQAKKDKKMNVKEEKTNEQKKVRRAGRPRKTA